jgi:hypothetical protein
MLKTLKSAAELVALLNAELRKHDIGAVHQRGKHRRRKDQCNDSNTPEQVQALKPPSQRPEQLFVLSLSSRCRPVAPLGEHVSQTI